MQKIKITATTRINKSKSLENIDISYGISFVTYEDGNIITINESNSWRMKLLSKLDKIGYFFMRKQDKHENKLIINQILEDSSFIAKHHQETSENLELQINSETMIIKKLKASSRKVNNDIHKFLDENVSLFASNFEQKKIFLGLNTFKPGDELFDELSTSLSREEIISYVLFHEYSHSAEFENNLNYNRHNIGNHFDRLHQNILYINNDAVHSAVEELIKDDSNLKSPSIRLLNTLTLLHQEMYADIRAILLMRHKDIINGEFNEEKTEKRIKAISQLRKLEKNALREGFADNDTISFNHFTSPSVECLDKQLKFFLQRESNNVLLNEEDIHRLTVKCVQEGIGRTLLAMEKADEKLYKQINTLFCVEINNKINEVQENYSELSLHKDKYIYARHEINDIISPEWKENFNNNLSKIENISASLVFDAALDSETFEKRLNAPAKEIYQISAETLQKSFDSMSNTIDEIVNQNTDNIKIVAARISELRDKPSNIDNNPKIK